MARKSKQDVAAAKAKKQKKIVIVGSVLFVALLAFQVPRTMKMLDSSAPAQATPPPAATEAAPAPGAPAATAPASLAPPTLEGSTAATPVAATVSPGDYPAADVSPQPKVGHLVAFGRFRSKDPFASQATTPATAASTPAPAQEPVAAAQAAVDAAASASTAAMLGGTSGADAGMATGAATTPAAAAALPTSAVLSVNGVEEPVAVTREFPATEPTFVLVSLTRSSAKIAVAGGTYATGDPTITLQRGKAVTLMNTADGTRYELKLVSVG